MSQASSIHSCCHPIKRRKEVSEARNAEAAQRRTIAPDPSLIWRIYCPFVAMYLGLVIIASVGNDFLDPPAQGVEFGGLQGHIGVLF